MSEILLCICTHSDGTHSIIRSLLEEPYDKGCTLCLKTVDHYYFHDNFGKSGPRFIVLLLLNSEMICGGTWN